MTRHDVIKPPLLVIAGPTASGKSDTALFLAQRLDTEIISADSVQVYRHFDIGTAKPTPDMTRAVPHHLINVVEPEEEYTVARFREEAREIALGLWARGKLPIVAGGTGLYIKALVEGMQCGVKADAGAETTMDAIAGEYGQAELYARAVAADPEWMKKIHPNDTFRTRRALGVYLATGKRMSDIHAEYPNQPEWDAIIFVLNPERDILYRRIERRTDYMLENGWKEEVRNLIKMGYNRKIKPMRSLGYKTLYDDIAGHSPPDKTAEIIKQETRHFAKRQLVWFRGIKDAIFVQAEENDSAAAIAGSILQHDEFRSFCKRHGFSY